MNFATRLNDISASTDGRSSRKAAAMADIDDHRIDVRFVPDIRSRGGMFAFVQLSVCFPNLIEYFGVAVHGGRTTAGPRQEVRAAPSAAACRSLRRLVSNSANIPSMSRNAFPAAVVVSIVQRERCPLGSARKKRPSPAHRAKSIRASRKTTGPRKDASAGLGQLAADMFIGFLSPRRTVP